MATPATYARYTGNWKGTYMTWVQTPESSGFLRMIKKTVPGLDCFWLACGSWRLAGGHRCKDRTRRGAGDVPQGWETISRRRALARLKGGARDAEPAIRGRRAQTLTRTPGSSPCCSTEVLCVLRVCRFPPRTDSSAPALVRYLATASCNFSVNIRYQKTFTGYREAIRSLVTNVRFSAIV